MDLENQIKFAAMLVKRLKPNVPQEFIEIQQYMTSDAPSQDSFCKLVSRSPERVAELLKLAKKACKADDGQDFSSLKQIAHVYGLYPLYALYLAMVVEGMASTKEEINIMNYNRNVALASAQIAHWIYGLTPPEAYLIGLLHNIGSLMGVRHDKNYQSLFVKQVFYPYSGVNLEVKKLQTSHCLIGALQVKSWGLRNEISKAIILHHDHNYIAKTSGNKTVRQYTAMLKLANFVTVLRNNVEAMTPELLEYRDLAKQGLEDIPVKQVIKAAVSALENFGEELEFLSVYEEALIAEAQGENYV